MYKRTRWKVFFTFKVPLFVYWHLKFFFSGEYKCESRTIKSKEMKERCLKPQRKKSRNNTILFCSHIFYWQNVFAAIFIVKNGFNFEERFVNSSLRLTNEVLYFIWGKLSTCYLLVYFHIERRGRELSQTNLLFLKASKFSPVDLYIFLSYFANK